MSKDKSYYSDLNLGIDPSDEKVFINVGKSTENSRLDIGVKADGQFKIKFKKNLAEVEKLRNQLLEIKKIIDQQNQEQV